MKKSIVQKGTAVLTALAVAASFSVFTASAAPLTKDAPKGYAQTVPGKNDAGVLTSENFETDKIDENGVIGKFAASIPDDSAISPAKIEVVSGVSHSGSKSLKVSARGTNASGEPQGYNTLLYKDIGVDIAGKFVKDSSNANKTENYYITAWVRNVDPKVTQYFWVQLQYGGSGEVWLPGDTYYKVSGSSWTQIGVAVVNNKVYYEPFTEDSTKSGLYPPRNLTTWSAMKFITKNPKVNPADVNEKIVQTNNDFYIDDIVIWKVTDTSKLVATLPTSAGSTKTTAKGSTTTTKAGGSSTSSAAGTLSSASSESTAVSDSSALSTETSTITTAAESSNVAAGGNSGGSLGAGAVVGIIAAIIVVLGGGFCLYWFVLRKKFFGSKQE